MKDYDKKTLINSANNCSAMALIGSAAGTTIATVGFYLGRSVLVGGSAGLGAIMIGGCLAIDYAIMRGSSQQAKFSLRSVHLIRFASKALFTLAVATVGVSMGILSIPTAAAIPFIWISIVLYNVWKNPISAADLSEKRFTLTTNVLHSGDIMREFKRLCHRI